MDRNREARRASILGSNAFNRRRHRTNSLRDSPDEDGRVELQESVRLRERVKKDHRDRDRERERERERERSSRSKRKRAGDSSDESVNDEDDDDDDEEKATTTTAAASSTAGNGGGSRLLTPGHTAVGSTPYQNHHQSNHHHINSSQNQPYNSNSNNNSTNSNYSSGCNHHHHLQHRKTFPPSSSSSSSKILRTAPVWKPGDEMIGVSVPRKARSASAKRSHDWIANTQNSGAGVTGGELSSSSPVRQGLVSTSAPSPAAPTSPSSSNAPMRKKLKPGSSSTGPKQKPPKASSKPSSSNPEELEIEIAEVLYGLSHQSQGPSSKKEDSREANKSSSDTKSRVSSPVSNSTSGNNPVLTPNPAPLSAVAPKRKRPRQVSENLGQGVRNSPISAKVEIDQMPKSVISSPNLEKVSGSPAENHSGMGNFVNSQVLPELTRQLVPESKPVIEEFKEVRDIVENQGVTSSGKVKENMSDDPTPRASASVTVVVEMDSEVSEVDNERDKKFEIDLMAPPPQGRSSSEREAKAEELSEKKPAIASSDAEMKNVTGDKRKSGKENLVCEEKKSKGNAEEADSQKGVENKQRNTGMLLDLENFETDGSSTNATSSNKLQQKNYLSVKLNKEEADLGKSGQNSSSLPMPMSMPGWPGGLPPMGYMAPLQGVLSMDGSTATPASVQPPFPHPRPKRCATHCYIARNINYLQQLMKMNPFWPAAAGSPSLFGSKPCNLNVLPSMDLHGNMGLRGGVSSTHDKGQGLGSMPGLAGNEKGGLAATTSDSAQRKQQILLQQPLPPVPPSNLLGSAFIFPLNQQQLAVAAASARPSGVKPPTTTTTTSGVASSTTSISAGGVSATAGAPTGMTFNYPSMPANETQYLAILQNGYPIPIPAVGAAPNYRGPPAQAMPLFNGSFYPSQIIHPSQLHQHQQPVASQSQQMQQAHQNTSMSSASSSQKPLQGQQPRPQGNHVNGGNLQNFPAQKTQPPQVRHPENELGGVDSPSTADSRGSRSMNIYGQNFGMPIHPHNFAMMTPPTSLTGAAAASTCGSGSQSEKKQQPLQQGSKTGSDSLPPQAFAMSFGPINGTTAAPGIDITSMPPNHPIFQSFPETTRQNIQMMAAAAASQFSQKKNFKVSEDGKSGGGEFPANDDERKGPSGKSQSAVVQSIAFARSDLADSSGSSIQANNVADSSARTLNLASGPRSSRSATSNNAGVVNVPAAHMQAQLQQQQILQLHKQQQQQLSASANARSKATSNGSIYSEHLNPSPSVGGKFPSAVSGFPQNFVQRSSSSPSESPQWKNSMRSSTSQTPSTLASSSTVSSLKNLPQQQARAQQMHTQISFGVNQKPSAAASSSQPSANSNQRPSSPMMVGSPTTSSISRSAGESPRTSGPASTSNKSGQGASLSTHQAKNSASAPSQKSLSILGNPHMLSSSTGGAKPQMQQQLSQPQQLPKNMQQAQLFFSNPYLQMQSPHSASIPGSSSYFMPRRRQDQPVEQAQGSPTLSSAGILSLSPSVSLASTSTNDPAKVTNTANCNVKGGGGSLSSQGIIQAAQIAAQSSGSLLPAGFSYVTVPAVSAAVQVKPAEQKQPAG